MEFQKKIFYPNVHRKLHFKVTGIPFHVQEWKLLLPKKTYFQFLIHNLKQEGHKLILIYNVEQKGHKLRCKALSFRIIFKKDSPKIDVYQSKGEGEGQVKSFRNNSRG